MKPLVLVWPRVLAALSIVIEIGAMTLWPIILTTTPMGDVTLRHETIHLRQQRECFLAFGWLPLVLAVVLGPWWALPGAALAYLPFYMIYGGHWLWNRTIKRMDGPKAYENIVFEKEAYVNEHYERYLEKRHPFSWLNYW